jgi:hypothetical protein
MMPATTSHFAKPGIRVHGPTHLFANGQTVRLKNGYLATGKVYLITASLPFTGAAPQYRIRSEAENYDRMAAEADLELAESSPPDQGETSAEAVFSPQPQA